MSCDNHQHYLMPSDLVMIECVLAHFDPQQSSSDNLDAAKFLVRKFQEGTTEEVALTEALDRYLRILRAWRSKPPCSDDSSQVHDRHGSGPRSVPLHSSGPSPRPQARRVGVRIRLATVACPNPRLGKRPQEASHA